MALTSSDTVGPQEPIYSPDSTQIAFEVVREPDIAHRQVVALYKQPLDGSAQASAVVRGPVSGAQFSPDGAHLLVPIPSRRDSSRRDLYVGNAEGTSQPLNITKGKGNVTDARWSPALPKEK